MSAASMEVLLLDARSLSPTAALAAHFCWSLKPLSAATTVPVSALRQEVRSGRLAARRSGRRILVSTQSFLDWFDRLAPAAARDGGPNSPIGNMTTVNEAPQRRNQYRVAHRDGIDPRSPLSIEDEAEEERLREFELDALREASEDQEEDWGEDWERDE